MVLVFVWSSSIVESVSILTVIIPALIILISLFVVLLVSSVSAVVSVEALSIAGIITAGVAITSVI